MDTTSQQCLEAFPAWLSSLPQDALALGSLLSAESIPPGARRYIAGALSYLHKSLDLIPDSVEDLGYLDDAFVLRVAARIALREEPSARQADIRGLLGKLADDAALIDKLLGRDFARLETYVRNLKSGAARGRTVDEILGSDEVCAAFVHDLHDWAQQYKTPSFEPDDKNLVKLTSFLSARLP